MDSAPFFADVAGGPAPAHCLWLGTSDGVRIRAGLWTKGEKGTVLLFPGRTEYVEKYASAAADLAARGFACAVIDWRGQGLADRPLADRNVGHVDNFLDYQNDLQAVLAVLDELFLPAPRFLMTHSMGGCIGLRSLYEGLGVRAAVFSAPMWGIQMAAVTKPLARALSMASKVAGFGHVYAPSTGPTTYVAEAPFADNVLTSDPAMFALMKRQVTIHPELALGGPSLHWLHEALSECRSLEARPSPAVPTLTFLGSNERVVDRAAIEARMARWPGGNLEHVQGAEHEVCMEGPATRAHFFDAAAALYTDNT